MINQDLIDGAIDLWSKRITMVIQAHGGHFEHRLKWYWTLMNSYTVSTLLFLDLDTWTELSEITYYWYANIDVIYEEHLTTA